MKDRCCGATGRFFVLLLLPLVLIASIIVGRNARAVATGRRVGLALDWNELQGVAQAARIPAPELAAALRQEGAEFLVIREETFGRLADTGRLQVFTGWQLWQAGRLLRPANPVLKEVLADPEFRGSTTYLLIDNETLFTRLKTRLALRFAGKVRAWSGDNTYVLAVDVGWANLRTVGVGVNVEEAEKARTLSYEPILVWQDADKTRAELGLDLEDVASLAPPVVLPGPLPPDLRAYAGAELKARGVLVGVPEFDLLPGAGEVAGAAGYRAVRVYERPVHTIYEEYLLAVRDRNVRLVIPHLLWQPRPDLAVPGNWVTPGANRALAESNVGHIRRVAGAVRAAGFELGRPEPFPPHEVSRPVLALLLALVVGTAAVGLGSASRRGRLLAVTAALAMAGAAFALPSFALTVLRKAVALAVAGVVPAVAVAVGLGPAEERRPLFSGLRALACAGALTLAGGVVVQALLGDTAFLLKLDAFSGIKLAYGLTLGLVYLWALSLRAGTPDWWRRPFLAPAELLGVAVLALAVWVLFNRSGNSSVIPIPAWELKARSFLEAYLFVRPRTKEFLLGHPALVLAGAGLGRGRWWRPYLLTLAAVGPASLMNTFTHLHTPFLISLARGLLGLVLGGLLGTLILAGAGNVPVGGKKRHA
ncbi:MAG: hypothetical protein PWQ41_1102 [Bacillota bacterium]|nr:hypothetical protein [Bacillota bacterium]